MSTVNVPTGLEAASQPQRGRDRNQRPVVRRDRTRRGPTQKRLGRPHRPCAVCRVREVSEEAARDGAALIVVVAA